MLKLSFVDFICRVVRGNGNIAEILVGHLNSGSIIGESILMYCFPQNLVTLTFLDLM